MELSPTDIKDITSLIKFSGWFFSVGRGDREVGKGEQGNEGITKTNKHTRERDCTIEALALFNQLKLIINLWRALMLVLDK